MTVRRGGGRGDDRRRRPQLQIWDDEGREAAIGTLTEDGTEWEMLVILEPASTDLVRGKLSFRRGEERYDTAAVLVEDTPEAVLQRATRLPGAMLRQLLLSARG